jgi:hypothetical protein
MVAAGHRGQRSGPVSIDRALSNHATQRTPCARRLKKGKNTVGVAHGAADGERWADNEGRKGHTLDGGENCGWGEKHPSRTYAVSSTGGDTGVWASGKAE